MSCKSATSRIIGILLSVILVLMVLYIGATLFLRLSTGNKYASLFGYTTHWVATDSMTPNINPGDIIIVKKCNTYRVGDVITYIRSDGLSITHRIVFADIGGYILQGDDNPMQDPDLVLPSQIVGKVVIHIPCGSASSTQDKSGQL